jgi:FlaA1/EpsC-like NDP-sugar epimerase
MIYKTQHSESVWNGFAGNSWLAPPALLLKEYISEKTLLVTGAGGSIGSALARFATTCNPEALILFDTNEHGLHALEQSLVSSKVVHVPVLGSICDSASLSELFALHQPQIVLHAAACKHVPLMEANPLAAASTNVLGTYALLRAASAYGAAQFIMVSTDKAVLPVSIMGATKRLAELLLVAYPDKDMQRKAVRLGNVLGSSGSIGPLFLKQIREGGPVTVANPEARRFFITLNRAVILLLAALSPEYETGILVPHLDPARRVEELAGYLINATARDRNIEIIFTGLRSGDKVEERLFSACDGEPIQDTELFFTVQPKGLATTTLYEVMEQISGSVRRRDLQLLLESIRKAVPEYRPGKELRQVIENRRRVEVRE